MVALPLLGPLVTSKMVPSERPSSSEAVRVPVMEVSSLPEPLVSPPMVVGSSTSVTLMV